MNSERRLVQNIGKGIRGAVLDTLGQPPTSPHLNITFEGRDLGDEPLIAQYMTGCNLYNNQTPSFSYAHAKKYRRIFLHYQFIFY